MNILHIAEFGERATGIGTVVGRLYNEQLSLGHDVNIMSVNENLAYKHLPIIEVKDKKDFEDNINLLKPDAVLFHSLWAMPYIDFSKVLKRHRIPYGVMMHGANSVENHKKGRFKKIISHILWFDKFLRDAATVVYLSKQEYYNCVSKDVNPHYSILPNGCDSIKLSIEEKQLHEPIDIVYLGRLIIHHKGLDILLDAIKQLRDKGFKKATFKFYGNETDVDVVALKEELGGMSEIASYEGPAYGDKKDMVLRNADAFILTSRYEGMPMGVLEAISYGVPCILTPGTNMLKDVVGAGAGWGADFDVTAIANTIEKACFDLEKDHLQYNKAAYRLSKNYDWKLIGEKSIDIMKMISDYYK